MALFNDILVVGSAFLFGAVIQVCWNKREEKNAKTSLGEIPEPIQKAKNRTPKPPVEPFAEFDSELKKREQKIQL